MAIKIIGKVLLITGVFFQFGLSCRKGSRPCQFGSYSFSATSEWSNQREIYNVGDTIFLNSSFPKTLQDALNSSITVNFSNAIVIGGGIGIGYLDTVVRRAVPARNQFDYISIIGSTGERAVAPDQGLAFSYAELADRYSFKCGLICRQKGIFTVSVADLKSPGINGKNCTNAGFSMTVTNSEKHFSLYQYALGFQNDADGIRRGYCFRVQ